MTTHFARDNGGMKFTNDRNMPSFNKDDVKDVGNFQVSNRGAISTKYVILLCVESFLLGGTVVFLIMNNIDSDKKSRK